MTLSYPKLRRTVVVAATTAILLASAAACAADAAKIAQAKPAVAMAKPAGPTAVQGSPAVAFTPAGGMPITSTAAGSDDPIPATNSEFYVREGQLQGELALLELQAKIADVKKKIANAANGANDISLPPPSVIVAPPASMTPQSGTPSDPARGAASSVTLPLPDEAPAPAPLRLVSVLGIGGDYSAQIQDHGVDCTVTESSVLPDGWRVVRIASSTVLLVRGRAHRILHVSN